MSEQEVIDLADAMNEADYEIRGGFRTYGDFARFVAGSDWLASRLAAARAEAWDEGAHAGGLMETQWDPIPNPYRDTSA